MIQFNNEDPLWGIPRPKKDTPILSENYILHEDDYDIPEEPTETNE